MKIYIKNFLYVLSLALLIFACEPKLEVPAPSSGTADFSNYIAVGNSLTAGYADGGLYADGQQQSYPSIVAQQLNLVSPVNFVQPDIPGEGSGHLYLKSLDLSTDPPGVDLSQVNPDDGWLDQIEGPFNNLGVPGIRVKDVPVKGYGATPDFNPYLYRMLKNKSNLTSYMDLLQESNPTFFTCWLGNNDVLGYAASGGAAGIDGQPGTGLDGLTPINEFSDIYSNIMTALQANSAKGIVITIPNVTSSPYFTQIPWNGAVLEASDATLANAFYAATIDPGVRDKVKEGVIQLTVTEQAVSAGVVPTVAQGAVYQQAYANAIAGGATPTEADAIASAYVASAEGQTAIAALEDNLNAELQNHLLGSHDGHQSLEPLYNIIDNELQTNATLQAAIAQGITDLTLAYDNDLLPPADKAALDAAIDQQTQVQIAGLKAAGIYPVFNEGPNAFVIEVPVDASNPLGIRQMKEGEYVLLTALLDGQLDGTKALEPKADKYILTQDEVSNINTYTQAYNDIIKSQASSSDVGLVVSDDLLQQINDGVFVDGVAINGDFILGGAFSLDGIHLTPRGYAIVANKIIEVINKDFGGKVPPVLLNDYRPVILP